jgi:hypothetical protein
MTTQAELERRVIEMLLAGEEPSLAILRRQLDGTTVSSRKFTGVGFYTEFIVSPEFERVAKLASFKLGDVNGSAANIEHGMGFLLYITDGCVSMLEGYTYGEPWPKEVIGAKLSYSGGVGRDMDKIKKIIYK